jgi:hypothetical protein
MINQLVSFLQGGVEPAPVVGHLGVGEPMVKPA